MEPEKSNNSIFLLHPLEIGNQGFKKNADSDTTLRGSFRSQTQDFLKVFIHCSFNDTLLPLKLCLHITSEASVHPSIHPPTHHYSTHSPIHSPSIHLSTHPPHQPTHHSSICLSPYLFTNPPFRLSSVTLPLPLFLPFLLHTLGYAEGRGGQDKEHEINHFVFCPVPCLPHS